MRPVAAQPSAHLRTGLLSVLAVAASLAASLVALGQDDAGGAAASAWTDDRYASRPEAALPPSEPYLGPPPGSVYAPSTVIYPEQSIPLRFFHNKHIEIGMECATCHAGALTSTQANDRLIPPMELCLDCHVIEDGVDAMPPADCSTCHLPYAEEPAIFDEDIETVDEDTFRQVENPPPLMVLPTPQLKFPHAVHTDAAGIACATCHGDMEQVELATRFNLPTMDLCLDCHTGTDDAPEDDCATCHLAVTEGRLLTELPTGVLMPTGRFRPDDHRFDYLENHRHTAQSDVRYCNNCHTEAWCEDCHNGVVKVMAIHPPNYVQTHAIDAYADQPDCESCHTTQDFCLGCHQQVGLRNSSLSDEAALSLTYHPEGWVRTDAIGMAGELRSEHGKAAQRNIAACSACHTESLCIECHSTQSTAVGVPVNPHPSNWLDICGAAMQRNLTSCIKCHLVNDPLLRQCD